jgi:Tfp pilus assembly protein PilO
VNGLPEGVRGRVLALVLTVAAVATVWTAVIEPVAGWYRQREETLAERRTLARHMAGVVALLPQVQRARDPAQPNAAAAPALLSAPTDALAAAALQETVQKLAQQAGATLSREETLPAEVSGPYRRIALRIATKTPYPAIVDFLRLIAEASPPLIVDDLRLRPDVILGASVKNLDASLTVIAFRTGGDAKSQ